VRIKMLRYREAARVEEIPRNGMKVVNVDGLEVLLVNVDGKFYAVENQCPHMGYPLYLGGLDGKILVCGFHHAKFDVTSGKALNSVTGKSLRTFGIIVKHSLIFIRLH